MGRAADPPLFRMHYSFPPEVLLALVSLRMLHQWREVVGEAGDFRKIGVMRGVTGVYDMTPDSRPLLGEIPGVDSLFVCAGFSRMGFKISPAIGLVMSELLLDRARHNS
jgi:glycine/D-amino acid oxidase-like deaminating enzyme